MKTATEHRTNRARAIVPLMAFEAATLAAASALHLTGAIQGGSAPFKRTDAGIAEAAICLVLLAGSLWYRRGPDRGWPAAVAATSFAVVGFGVGLNFTLRGGDAPDVAYHLVMLPILVGTLVLLLRREARPGAAGLRR